MAEHVAHLGLDANPKLTACGEPWQGWQSPPGYTDIPGHVELAPHDQPRPHVDQIRQCQACLRVAMTEEGASDDLGRPDPLGHPGGA